MQTLVIVALVVLPLQNDVQEQLIHVNLDSANQQK